MSARVRDETMVVGAEFGDPLLDIVRCEVLRQVLLRQLRDDMRRIVLKVLQP